MQQQSHIVVVNDSVMDVAWQKMNQLVLVSVSFPAATPTTTRPQNLVTNLARPTWMDQMMMMSWLLVAAVVDAVDIE